MQHGTSHPGLQRYADERRAATARAARVTTVCALALIPVFAYLDTVVFPAHATEFVVWRLITFLVGVVVLAFLHAPLGRRFPLLLGVTMPIAIGIDVELVTLLVGREANPYYAGLIVILLGASLLLPWTPLAALVVSTILVGGYGGAMLATGPIANVPLFTSNLILLGGAAALVVVGATVSERLRWREFQSRMALDAHAHRQEAVARLGQLALGDTSARDLMDRAVALVPTMLGFELAAVLELAADERTLVLRSGTGWRSGLAGHATVELAPGSQAQHVLARGAVFTDDLAAETRFAPIPLLARHGAASGICVPIAGRERPVGLLIAYTVRRRLCITAEVECLESLAGVLTTAILREEAAHALAAEAQASAALAKVGRDLISSLDTPVLLDRLCQRTAEALGTDHSVTWLLDPAEHAYRPISSHGMSEDKWEALRALHLPATSIASIVERFERDEMVELTPQSHEHPVAAQVIGRLGVTRSLLLPLRRGGKIVGVQTNSYRGRTEPFTRHQGQLAGAIAQLASMALSNARLFEELERTSRLKSEFVSTMSHELRTPLNVIVGYLDILAEELGASEHRALLARARTASIELLEMIDATLNLNRIAAGQDPPVLADVDVAELWDELASDFAAVPRKTAAALRWEPPGDVVLGTDRRKLKIVVKNLVGNALKFTPTGEVVARCELAGDACLVTVRDTGIGIPTAHLPYIFDMFRQVDSTDARSYAGAGLGLYIVKSLLAQLGGEVHVDSAPGQGSTFTIRLPRATVVPAHAGATRDHEARSTAVSGTSAAIHAMPPAASATSADRIAAAGAGLSPTGTATAGGAGGSAAIAANGAAAAPDAGTASGVSDLDSDHAVDRGAELASAAHRLTETAVTSAAAWQVAAGAAPARRKRRIVFADDLEVNRHLLRRFLAREMPDVECLEAADGLQALALVEAHKPDLILLDLRMPEMDGWQAARRIRALENGRDVPIIALSVTASAGVEAYAIHAGCNEFVTKPVSDYGALMARITHWLGRSDADPGAPDAADADICVLCRQPLPRSLIPRESAR